MKISYWLICYDISDNKIRYRTERLLQAYGERIQWSVFECAVTYYQIQKLKSELTKLIEPGDRIHFYPICHWCSSKRLRQGSAFNIQYQEFEVV